MHVELPGRPNELQAQTKPQEETQQKDTEKALQIETEDQKILPEDTTKIASAEQTSHPKPMPEKEKITEKEPEKTALTTVEIPKKLHSSQKPPTT